jgi:hypothetical protein
MNFIWFIMALCFLVVLCRFVLLPLWFLLWEIPLRFIEKRQDKDWVRRFFAPTVLWLNFIFAFLLSAILYGLILACTYRQFSEQASHRWLYWLLGCLSVGMVGTISPFHPTVMLNVEKVKEIMLKNKIWRLVGIVVFLLVVWLVPATKSN